MQQMKIEVIKSRRKTIGIEIKQDLRVIVRAPYGMTRAEIDSFINKNMNWIETHYLKLQEKKEHQDSVRRLTQGDMKALADRAMKVIPERVAHYAPIVGVTYGKITIRNQKTRWGSCSSKGNLNFNCLLMLMPIEVIDSVVVHELCHRKEMNHSKAFYQLVYKAYPEYDQWHGWLKEHGGEIMRRMTG